MYYRLIHVELNYVCTEEKNIEIVQTTSLLRYQLDII